MNSNLRANLTPEQAEIVEYLGGNILVSASAGSGKTHTMTERILKLICEDGVSVNQILAVTFTDASATDMREKIRLALNKKIEEVSQTNAQLALKLAEEVKELPTADVSTIHGFCGKLIRSYFYSVGVAPDFKILDKSEADAMRQDAVNKTFSEFYSQGGYFLTLIDRHAHARKDGKLKELILTVYKYMDSEAYPEKLLEKSTEHYTEKGVKRLAEWHKNRADERLKTLSENLENALFDVKNDGLKKAEAFTSTLLADVKLCLACKDIYSLKAKYKDYKLNLSYETKLDEGQLQTKERVKALRDEFYDVISKACKYVSDDFQTELTKAQTCLAHTQAIIDIVKRFTQIYSSLKREENALDFNDLEHFALKVLSDDVLAEIRDKYEYIFVDEYQDTNGVQDQIVSAIQSNNLLMVGDVKQSIYGFRGCRSEFFSRKDQKMQLNGEKVVRLNKNFRSAKAVICAVNEIFNFCMTKDFYGESYRNLSQLTFGEFYPDGFDGRVELHRLQKETVPTTSERPRIYDLLKDTAEYAENDVVYTAALVNKIITDELKKEYYDIKEKDEKRRLKKVEYKDIAVLTRAKESEYVTGLVHELTHRYGIPVSSVAEESLCDYPEITMLINALKAVDCVKWDLPLASTLKSPIGGFSEEELFEIAGYYLDKHGKTGGSFYQAYEYYLENAVGGLATKLKEFDEYFKEVRFVADFVGAGGALKKLIADKNLRAYLYASKGGEEKVKRLNAFLQTATPGGVSLTVKNFLNRIETSPDAFIMPRIGGENAVSAMTIHASKGLEYPVVIVCGLERSFVKDNDGAPALLSREYGMAVKYFDDEKRSKHTTPLRGVLLEEIAEQTLKEEMRLFYVATTRAKYSLHLVYASKNDDRKDAFNGANRYLDFIPSSMPETVHCKSDFDLTIIENGNQTDMFSKADEKLASEFKRLLSFEYPYSKDVELPIKSNVTELNAREKQEYYDILKIFSETDTETKTGATLGTNAHRVLELFDFTNRARFKGEINRMLNDGLITSETLDGLDLDRLEKTLLSSAFDGLADKEIYREQSFIINVPANLILDTSSQTPVLVQGVIDLLVIDGDGAKVIDYKYSALSPDGLKEKYAKQLNLYAYAVEKCLGKKVTEKVIVSLLSGNVVLID